MRTDMKALARLGAQARLTELHQEIHDIERAFPDLRRRPMPRPAASSETRKHSSTPRKRRSMTAAARKAVGERMKKYWAARRKAAGPQAAESTETKPAKVAANQKRNLSTEARARISAAQKKRWAAHRRATKKKR
jgi:hypothetical protein